MDANAVAIEAVAGEQKNGHRGDPLFLPSHDGRELLDKKLETPDFYVPGVVAPGQITALGGYTGAGKSPAQADLIKSMLEGKEFCGIEIGQTLPTDFKFVFFTQESEYTFKPMLERAGLGSVLKTGQLEILYLHEVLATGATWEQIVERAQAKFSGSEGLLLIDPMSDCSLVKNEDDNSQMAEVYRPLVMVAGTGLSVLTVVHAWKSFDKIPDEEAAISNIRGAGAIVSNCSLVWMYKHPAPMVEDPNVRFLRQVRTRVGGRQEDRYVRLGKDGLEVVEDPHSITLDYHREKNKVFDAIRKAGKDGILNAKLPEMSGVDRRKTTGHAEALEMEKQVYSTGKKQSKTEPLTWYVVEVSPAAIPSSV